MLMVGQSKLMPGQLPRYARVWLRLWAKPKVELLYYGSALFRIQTTG